MVFHHVQLKVQAVRREWCEDWEVCLKLYCNYTYWHLLSISLVWTVLNVHAVVDCGNDPQGVGSPKEECAHQRLPIDEDLELAMDFQEMQNLKQSSKLWEKPLPSVAFLRYQPTAWLCREKCSKTSTRSKSECTLKQKGNFWSSNSKSAHLQV